MVAERHRTGWDHAGPQKRQLCKAKARLLHPKSSSRHTLDRPMGKGGERYAIRDKNDLVSLSTLARFLGGAIPASVYVSLLPVVEACVVVAVPGHVGEVRVPAVDLDPSVLARRLDAPATVGFLTGRPRGPAAVAQGLLVAQ